MGKLIEAGGESFEGVLQVLYGSPRGLGAATQQWRRSDVVGDSTSAGGFGQVMATGDFDGDGCTDLAVSDISYDDGSRHPGDVVVVYGSRLGLTPERTQVWNRVVLRVAVADRTDDGFGSALAVSDLGRGPEEDLAIGARQADGVGKVVVLYGSPRGLVATDAQWWGQAVTGVPGGPQRGDGFGAALVAGDLDQDHHNELVIGVPGDADGDQRGGSVVVLQGTRRGLSSAGAEVWRPGHGGILGRSEDGAMFGASLAVGDFTGRGVLDLVVGTPGRDLFHTAGAGSVTVIYGTPKGLRAAGNQRFDEYALGARDADDVEPEDNPGFGSRLAVGDLGLGPADDLVIAAPRASTPRFEGGAVQVLYGTAGGLSAADTQRIHQRLPGIPGKNSGQHFGSSLAVLGPLTDDPKADRYPLLAIGEPYYRRSGMVLVLHGSEDGVVLTSGETLEPEDLADRPVGRAFGLQMTGG